MVGAGGSDATKPPDANRRSLSLTLTLSLTLPPSPSLTLSLTLPRYVPASVIDATLNVGDAIEVR